MDRLVKLWLRGSGLIIAGLAIYAFVPILIPVIFIAVCLAGLTSGIVGFARWLERRLKRGPE